MPALLFLTTFLSATYAGLFYVYGDVGFMRMAFAIAVRPAILLQGVPFSFTLLTILLAHEMGHFIACRHYGIRCTPPFFIPLSGDLRRDSRRIYQDQVTISSTSARSLMSASRDRIAGFVFVVPALIIGIASSKLIAKGIIHGELGFGEPLLFRWVGKLVLGYSPARQDMLAHPIAMAAWFGMLATSLNLFPIWQLDGGHISYAIFGRSAAEMGLDRCDDRPDSGELCRLADSLLLVFCLPVLFFGMRYHFYHPPTLYDDEQLGTGPRDSGNRCALDSDLVVHTCSSVLDLTKPDLRQGAVRRGWRPGAAASYSV